MFCFCVLRVQWRGNGIVVRMTHSSFNDPIEELSVLHVDYNGNHNFLTINMYLFWMYNLFRFVTILFLSFISQNLSRQHKARSKFVDFYLIYLELVFEPKLILTQSLRKYTFFIIVLMWFPWIFA